MTVRIEEAGKEHIPSLVGGMSSFAKTELTKLYPDMDIETILLKSFEVSDEAYVIFVDDDLVCATGVNSPSLLSNMGQPWLIPHADNVTKHKFIFLDGCRRWIKYLSDKYPVLKNMGIANNNRSLKWLKWLGFTIGKPEQINGTWFVPYTLERKPT